MRSIVLRVVLLGLSLGLGAGHLHAQGRYDRCAGGGNPAIRTLLEQGRASEPLVYWFLPQSGAFEFLNTSNQHWATSSLAASGTPPTILRLPRYVDFYRTTPVDSADLAHALWTCQYSADRLADYDTTTAWCEGVPGDGIGEVVLFRADFVSVSEWEGPPRLQVWAGYGRSESLFRANSRPRQVRVWVVRHNGNRTIERRMIFDSVRVVGSRLVELQDVNGWQALPLPDIGDELRNFLVALELRSVYPGTRFHDTCISEIRFDPSGLTAQSPPED